jgi:hypothetical protein
MYKLRNHSDSIVKGLFIYSLFLIAIFQCFSLLGQSQFTRKGHVNAGFDVAFGTKNFNVFSDIPALDQMRVVQEGGAAGLFMGNDRIKVKIKQGYFYSASSVPQSVDLIESDATINLNFLQLKKIRSRNFDPYILAGIERNALKFYGFFNNKQTDAGNRSNLQNPRINYSVSETPYKGKVVALRATVGFGLAYRIPIQYSYVKVYSECKYGYPVKSSSLELKNTTVSNQFTVNAGVSFGLQN